MQITQCDRCGKQAESKPVWGGGDLHAQDKIIGWTRPTGWSVANVGVVCDACRGEMVREAEYVAKAAEAAKEPK